MGEGILALGWRGLGAAQREAAGARRGDAGAGRGESALHLGGRRLQADPELRSRGALRPVPRSQPGRGTGRGATGAGGGLDVRRCGSLGLPMLTEPENNVTSRPTPAAGGERRREPLPGVAGGRGGGVVGRDGGGANRRGLVAVALNPSPPELAVPEHPRLPGPLPPHLQSSALARRQETV